VTRRLSAVIGAAAAIAIFAPTPSAAADTPPSFRLCVDPDNLPFSSTSRDTPGFYVELGRAIAAQLGRPFEPVWELTYFARRAVRTSLLKGKCDGFIGLPEEPELMGPKLIFSKPVLDLGYALVLPRGTRVTTLSDLAGRRVAVQFASPPQDLLATRADIETVTTLSPEEALRDLKEGKADLAFTWGPSAGWLDKSVFGGVYDVVPVAGPHMQWRAAIGFRGQDAALRDQVNAAIDALAEAAKALTEKYGFPKGPPVELAQAEPASERAVSTPPEKADETTAASGKTAALPPPATPGSTAAGDPVLGHKLFNENCSHCHGPDAVQGERRRNLRLLHHRYGDDFDKVFMTTVTHGRVDKGMPNWSGLLTDAQFRNILAFLHSVQEP